MRPLIFLKVFLVAQNQLASAYIFGRQNPSRDETRLDTGWRFFRTENNTDGIAYDFRNDTPPAATALKAWILPSANDFINDPASRHDRPAGSPSVDIPYVKKVFSDSSWESVALPHDWAVKGPFIDGVNSTIGGAIGRLPINGVGWYRRTLEKTTKDEGKSIYLEVEGAMSYTMVWVNEQLVGGWPFGYNSFRLDLTPYLKVGDDNQLAIRVDNGVLSSRFYPGAGIYRDVWLTKVPSMQISQYGTFIKSRDVSKASAILDLAVQVENKATSDMSIEVTTAIHIYDPTTRKALKQVGTFPRKTVTIKAGQKAALDSSVTLKNPRLWGPALSQTPNLYVAVTRLSQGETVIDTYQTSFGVRNVTFDANKGLLVNGQHTYIQGVNQHHDLGALGSAFNVRAAERQLEILHELGVNAIRLSHNPPATGLLELTDRLGFLVIDEIFDMWERNKTTNDFHLIFKDWHEPDLRSFLRRDRNHPSIISWSYGNEVREQDSIAGGRGVIISQMLRDIVHEEDSTRPASMAQCCVGPASPFAGVPDIINLNYRGEGIGDTPPYAGNQTTASTKAPEYPYFHAIYPDKLLLGSEYSSSISTRGVYIFPVTNETSAPVGEISGGNSTSRHISSYDLYTTDAGSSPDRVFEKQDKYPYVAGGFVWSGFDYLGEPHPYLLSRSSSFGIIDLAGFKKDRFFLYQARWRPDLKFAHILPHWTWPERVNEITPVHVHSSADEAELFLNGESEGRLKKAPYTYRFRWDKVVYQPGELHVVTYKKGKVWAKSSVKTAGASQALQLSADRAVINCDGRDLSFISLTITDNKGDRVPRADDAVTFSVSDGGEILATDNGDSTDTTAFPSHTRKAFNGNALVIVRAKPGKSGTFTVTASAPGRKGSEVKIKAK
ncbi:hypothetical protein O988_04189 [Pseudogymnoascus sp. VKM F-3808]|nr:hypothetical protein O988_04189 [Pseudogymnoascus sp. VKM F-3808]